MDDADNLRNWSKIRALEPDRQDAFLTPARLLRDRGQFGEADDLLTEAMHRFSSAAEPLIEFALVAHASGNWDEALTRWEKVRSRFVHPVGYLYAGRTLIAAKRLNEADAILSEAFELFHDSPETVTDHAWIAIHQGRWVEGLRRSQNGLGRFPEAKLLYVGAAFCLRKLRRFAEADSLLTDAVGRFPQEISITQAWAETAQQRSDWPTALHRSDRLISLWPDQPEGYISAINCLIEMEHYEEAEARSSSALADFPDIPDFYQSHAVIAVKRGLTDEAIRRYRGLCKLFPENATPYVEAARLLAAQARWPEASELLEQGCDSSPTEPALRLELAKLGMASDRGKQRDLPGALLHVEALVNRFPKFEKGHLAHLSILVDLGEVDRAEAIGKQLVRQFPESPDIAIAHARTAAARGLRGISTERLFRVVDEFSTNPGGYIGLSQTLCAENRFAEAEDVIARAMKSFPEFPPIVIEYAQLATRREEWPRALARWTEAYVLLPNDLLVSTMMFETRMRVVESDTGSAAAGESDDRLRLPANSNGAEQDAQADLPAEVSDRELFMQFESLGGAMLGCEFGIVQRRFGAEPLGLLRWTEIRPPELLKALEERFAGVGLPENTEMQTRQTDKGIEYLTSDKNYYMNMHTFVYESAIARDDVLGKFCKRLQYLQRKILDDLKEASKIFVYKVSMFDLSDAQIERIYAAMRTMGDNTLLYVRRADGNKPAGLVEELKPGLLVGYIDRFAVNTQGIEEGIPVESWLALCRTAYAIWKEPADNRTISSGNGREMAGGTPNRPV